MTNREKAEQTIKDIKRRQALREQGIKAAKDFTYEQCFKAKKNRDKIRSRSYRGK